MKRVIIESPFAGDVERNRKYLRLAILHSLSIGEAPFASHEMYTRALDDNDPNARELGIHAGLAWLRVAERSVVYENFGVSKGMKLGMAAAEEAGIPIIRRKIHL
jgi:hypothetical protein